MSTETLTTQTTEAPASAESDSLSADEARYFETRGEAEFSAEPAKPSLTPPNQPSAPAATGDQQQPADDLDGAIEIDAEGRIRDAKSGRFVPQRALHAERERRRAAQQEAAKFREDATRLSTQLEILSQALQAPQAAQQPAAPADADPMPDPQQDIFGYVAWQQRELGRLKSQLEERTKGVTERIESREVAEHYRADANAFARETPDFGTAYMHLVKTVDAELQFRGVTDPGQRQAMIAQMEREEVAKARAAGKRPAEWIYNVSKFRGYSAAVNPAQNPTAAPVQAASQQTPANPPTPSVLDTVARGQQIATSLLNAPGGAPNDLTAESLARMSDAEFAAIPKDKLRRLLGG